MADHADQMDTTEQHGRVEEVNDPIEGVGKDVQMDTTEQEVTEIGEHVDAPIEGVGKDMPVVESQNSLGVQSISEQNEPIERRGTRKRKTAWKLRTPWKDTREDRKKHKTLKYDPLPQIPHDLDAPFKRWLDSEDPEDNVRTTAYAVRDKTWFRDLITPSKWMTDEVVDSIFMFVQKKWGERPELCRRKFTTGDLCVTNFFKREDGLYKEMSSGLHPRDLTYY